MFWKNETKAFQGVIPLEMSFCKIIFGGRLLCAVKKIVIAAVVADVTAVARKV
jgi:hypothetical protein